MKNKKNIYFLLLAVLVIWGVLGYRIYTSLSPNSTTEVDKLSVSEFKPQKLEDARTFSITANYRDPFLGLIMKKKVVKPYVKRPIKNKVEEKPFPTIVYKGLVSASGKKEQVFLISINGQQHFFKKNAVKNEVKLIKGSSNEVILQYYGKRKTFPIIK